jgi:hypothetical protein
MAPASEEQRGWVQRVLGLGMGQSEQAAIEGAAVRLAKGMLLWNQTRGYVAEQIKALQSAILKQTAGEPDFAEIRDNLGSLEEILEVLDDRLTLKLNEMRASTDAAAKRQLSVEARVIVAQYQAYVEEDELMNDIDQNGFIPLDIKPKVTATLTTLLSTI